MSNKRIERIVSVLRECSSLAEAANRLGTTPGGIRGVLRRAGTRASDYLRPAAWADVASDPEIPVEWEDDRLKDFAVGGPFEKFVAGKIDKADDELLASLQRSGAFDTGSRVSQEDPDLVQEQEVKEAEARAKRQQDRLIEEVRQLRTRQKFLDQIAGHVAPPRILPRESASGMRELTAVVLASDWHVEEPVDPNSVAGRNEYNLAIAEQRIDRFFQGIIWNIEHQRASKKLAIRDLVLWLGGDIMTGYIHEELVESSQLSPTETILWVMPRIRDGILSLLNRLDLASIVVPCSFGNHGRTTAKPRVSTGYANSFEWLMYNQLAELLASEKRVTFEITPSGHQYVETYGKLLHFHHGDDVKYMGGVGGLGIPLLKAVPMWDLVRKAAVHNIGHHHTLIDYGRAVVNGSLIGFGPYSQRIRAPFEPPQQVMYYMDSRRGKCMTTAIWVDSEEERARFAAAAGAAA